MSEKKSGAARVFAGAYRARLHCGDQRLDFLECIGHQLVMDPAPILAVAHDPSVLEHTEVKRKSRLCSIESIGELAHATLTFAEQLDNAEPGLVGQGMKELDRALGL